MRSPAIELVAPPPPPPPMRVVVWKYRLMPGMKNLIRVPINARILHVAGQGGRPTLWVQVQPENECLTTRTIAVVGTGRPLPGTRPDLLRYIGSAHCEAHVWHVFEDEDPGNGRD